MEWQNDPNKRAIGIVRRSSYGQKDNTSAETQEQEIQRYVQVNGLDLIKVEPIIESAYKTEERKKYQALMHFALAQGIKHILFYIGSREARNLTDNEKNESLIKEDKIIIHYVSENKVFDKNSPDSEFLARDILTAVNKNYSRENGTRVKNSFRTKAEQGWWPYRHITLGYLHHKDKDKFGNAIKGTAKVIVSTEKENVRLVQREFELRAQGISYDEIKRLNLAEKGLVPLGMRKTYSRHAIEVRLKNEFYWGYFRLTGEPLRYEGKHEKIIPAKILKAVEAVNSGNAGRYRASSVAAGDDIFRGWLNCDHAECRRLITFEKKRKIIKSTGQAKIYHLYRCSNSRRVHDKNVYISEEKVWNQLEPVVDKIDITEDFARDILAALDESFDMQQLAIKKQMEGFRIAQLEIRNERKNTVKLFTSGKISQRDYDQQIVDLEQQEDGYTNQLEHLNLLINDTGRVAVKKLLELAINAKQLWKSMERQQRVDYLKKVCSNPTLDELTLRYQMKKPFARLASWKGFSEWRGGRDSNPRPPP